MWRLLVGFLLADSVHAATWPLNGPLGKVPASFDCGMRKLAYSFGRQLLPRLGTFESLFYALGLNEDCEGQLAMAEVPGPAPHAFPVDALFVDASAGSDDADGVEQRPKRTIQAALQAAVAKGVTAIVLRGGTHYLEEPLQLGPEHSGLSIRSYPGEESVVSGGKKVTVAWVPHNVSSGANVYKASLQGQVRHVPGLHVGGVRATRARYPNLPAGIEASPGYGAMISERSAAWTPPEANRYGPARSFQDQDHVRNVTPDNWFQRYTVGTNGLCSVYDPPVSYWCSKHIQGGGATPFRTPSAVAPQPKALPHAPYEDPSQMLFFVWRPARWANWMFHVANVSVTDKAPAGNYTFGHGGFQGARGNTNGGDFFVENVFEELDNPGEFFFNESTGELYLFHNGTGPPPQEVVVPQLDVLVNVTGTQWKPVHNLTMEGVKFTATRYTYMHPHGVPSGGDWALERIGAIFLEGTEGVVLRNCSFERLDGHGVFISGYNRNATVQDSNFEFIGGSAMASWGYTNETENTGFPYYRPNANFPQAGVDGTDGNHPRGNRILRNLVREVGLYEKQNSFYVQAKTAQSTIDGNVFFNGPRAGINANDGFGGGDVISNNLVFSTCRESGDHGPFNSWDRQPYLTTVRTGEPSMFMAWRELHHNFLIDNYSPQEGIDNDDGSSYYHSHDNFLVYGMQGMKNDFGGHDNHHSHNVYAYIGRALGVTKTLKGHEDHFFSNKVVLTGTDVGTVMCEEPRTQLSGNQYFTPSGKITECKKSLADAQAAGLDLNSTVATVPSDAMILGWARELLGIKGHAADVLVVV